MKIKKTIVMLVAVFSIIVKCEAKFANKAVPEIVLKSFSQQYAKVHGQKWEVKEDTCIVRFRMSGKKCCAFYLSGGNWIKTETKIPWSKDLPKAVKNGWDKCPYANAYIQEMKQVTSPVKSMFIISVRYERGPEGAIPGDWVNDYVLYFDTDGSLVKKEHFQ